MKTKLLLAALAAMNADGSVVSLPPEMHLRTITETDDWIISVASNGRPNKVFVFDSGRTVPDDPDLLVDEGWAIAIADRTIGPFATGDEELGGTITLTYRHGTFDYANFLAIDADEEIFFEFLDIGGNDLHEHLSRTGDGETDFVAALLPARGATTIRAHFDGSGGFTLPKVYPTPPIPEPSTILLSILALAPFMRRKR